MIGTFSGFECIADSDILNKIKHKNNITKVKYGLCKLEFSIYP